MNENRNNKPPHFGISYTPKGHYVMDKYYFSIKEHLSEYEENRGIGICFKVRRLIKSLKSFSWSFMKNRDSLREIIINTLHIILNDMKILSKLGTRFSREFDLAYTQDFAKGDIINLEYNQWSRLLECLEVLDTEISELITAA